uniref:Uncharacterized protein n=1 Tax=Dromaius novaehollandiae TaxID=8790 RepID=A0A8C4JTL4_DRONO
MSPRKSPAQQGADAGHGMIPLNRHWQEQPGLQTSFSVSASNLPPTISSVTGRTGLFEPTTSSEGNVCLWGFGDMKPQGDVAVPRNPSLPPPAHPHQ